MNKKASLASMAFYAIVIFFFAVCVLFGYKLAYEFNSRIQADANMPATAKAATAQLTGYFPSVLDRVMLFLVVGLAIVTIIMAALVRVHPIFLVLFLIGLIFIIYFSAIFSNVYDDMALDTNLATQANNLPFISFIMRALPFIVGIFGFLLMIIMYKVWQIDTGI